MKYFPLLFLLTITAAGQSMTHNCDLTDAKSFFVMHSSATPAAEQKKIDKALRQAADLKQVDRLDRTDLLIDFTEPDWLSIWRRGVEGKVLVDRWPLMGSSVMFTQPGSVHSTTVYTRNVATSHTIINPPHRATVTISPEIHTASEFLFNLRMRRKTCKS